MLTVTKEIRLESAWSAWAGTTEQIVRINELLQTLIAVRNGTLAAEFEEFISQVEPNKRGDFTGAIQFDIELRAVAEGVAFSGPVNDVLSSLDMRSVDVLQFSLRGHIGSDELAITFSKSTGVGITVASQDVAWARRVIAETTYEIEKDVPAWSRMKTQRVGLEFGILPLVSGTTLILVLTIALRTLSLKWIVMAPIMALACFLLIFSILTLSNRFLPHFEVLRTPGRSSGGRHLKAIFALLATNSLAILIGIYVNAVS